MGRKFLYLDELNLRCLLKILIRKAWVIVLLCASAMLCYTSVCRLTYVPQYASTATFMVSAKDSTSAYNSLTTTQSMASVFVEVFQSNVLREKIVEQMPDGQFDGTITTNTIPETNLLVVTVTSGEPDTAFRALNLVVDNYSSISDYLFANAQLEVIKDPVVPVAPANPLRMARFYPLVLLLSGAFGLVCVVVLWLLRDTVQTPNAARRKVDARLLRTINHERKNKTWRAKYRKRNVAPLITNSLISKRFIEDNLSLCSALEYHARKRKQKVIMITSVAENEGKSTVAANLALAMAAKNRRVALLDCDFRKPALHKIFESPVEKDKTLSHYLLEEETDESCFLKKLDKYGLTLATSAPSAKSITRLINNGKLRTLLDSLRQQMDYIILDTPPMMAAADAEAIATMADTAVLIVCNDYMPAASINAGLDRLRKSAPEVCGFVLNNYRAAGIR